MKSKVLLYGHGGSYNHGAEAIVQTTCAMLRKEEWVREVMLMTHFKEQDIEYNLPVDRFLERDMRLVEEQRKDGIADVENQNIYISAREHIAEDTICLSVGGDNYCYNGWDRWKPFFKWSKAAGAGHILWSCSIEPSKCTKKLLERVGEFDYITARESISCRFLKEYFPDKVFLCADVAFLLEEQGVVLPEGWEDGNMLALNVSPLIFKTAKDEKNLAACINEITEYFCGKLGMKIALVPHVVMPMDNDYTLLKTYRENSKWKERMLLVSGKLSAAQYKYLISRCRFGVFARTHACIAAYSGGIPCIAIGYSTKARGIACDMGQETYFIDNRENYTSNDIRNLSEKLYNNELEIKSCLKERTAYMKELAGKNGDILRKTERR